jgi:hypothetical protein
MGTWKKLKFLSLKYKKSIFTLFIPTGEHKIIFIEVPFFHGDLFLGSFIC